MRALNEIGAMVQKAALGAHIPLGQAEDLGRVAIYLAGTGGDLRCVSDALAAPMTALDVKWDRDQITVVAGPVALAAPVIRDAFAMGVIRAELAQRCDAVLVQAGLAMAGFVADGAGAVLTLAATAAPAAPTGPVAVPDDIWQGWATLAAKTYVPESDASRIAGAGAGLTDND